MNLSCLALPIIIIIIIIIICSSSLFTFIMLANTFYLQVIGFEVFLHLKHFLLKTFHRQNLALKYLLYFTFILICIQFIKKIYYNMFICIMLLFAILFY